MTINAYLMALEVADETAWFKSSHSDQDNGGGCISVAVLTDRIGVRDSKQENGPAFVTPTAAWSSFIREVKSGRWSS
ncbi:DUF397 domain-containing protein [Streptomyces roseoverticillatus]|uniref:DUF397 domain-containing protein n=1 Tax=Streptomyces roseoverticillatus TaxID=66429 RepID=UPI001FE11A2F|nr:DUF397 domain-containing protein [Streptomyces roseoverticillatus]